VKLSLPEDAARLGLRLDRQALDRLTAFTEMLTARAIPLGLVSERDADRVYERHVLDSLRVATVLQGDDNTMIDIGSGAGLPGLVVGAARPELSMTLVDSRRRAGAFLELAVDELGLPRIEVRIARVEDVRARVDVCTARAFAPIGRSWEVARPLLGPGGRLVYFAGAGLKDPEEAALRASWPAPPGRVEVRRVIESSPPLVMMSLEG
jgi:16S rRNA (guanine527-N7)-methyltransferase